MVQISLQIALVVPCALSLHSDWHIAGFVVVVTKSIVGVKVPIRKPSARRICSLSAILQEQYCIDGVQVIFIALAHLQAIIVTNNCRFIQIYAVTAPYPGNK